MRKHTVFMTPNPRQSVLLDEVRARLGVGRGLGRAIWRDATNRMSRCEDALRRRIARAISRRRAIAIVND